MSSHTGTDRASGLYRPWLHRFAVAHVVATFFLVVLGGTVTSKGVGLSVPDWPTTFGHNMFGVPWELWVGKGGVFWEHSHRLMGSLVGLMMVTLAAWLWVTAPRGDRRRWVGVGGLVLVIVQGVMGGLRVTELSTALGVLHGVVAQMYLCLAVLIAAVTSRHSRWSTGGQAAGGTRLEGTTQQSCVVAPETPGTPRTRGVRVAVVVLLGVMVVQLVLGASMRHTGARLAIPDFPTAYGGWAPPLTDAGVRAAIDRMPYEATDRYYTAAQVGVHYAHRVWAVVVLGAAVWFLKRLTPAVRSDKRIARLALALVLLLVAQPVLGVLVVWTGAAAVNAEVATAHQAMGAALLATVFLLAVRVWGDGQGVRVARRAEARATDGLNLSRVGGLGGVTG